MEACQKRATRPVIWGYEMLWGRLWVNVLEHVIWKKNSSPFSFRSPLVGIFVLFVLYAFGPFIQYVLTKSARRWCTRRLEKIDNAHNQIDQNNEIKSSLRSIGFGSLWLAGFLQLPASLF